MLTREQKQQLRNLSEFKFFFNERNGIVMDNTGEKTVHFPSTEEIRSNVFNQIRNLGFTSITVVNTPRKANVILRIVSKKHQPYDGKEIHNLYGNYCFVRYGFSWIITCPHGEIRKTKVDSPIPFSWLTTSPCGNTFYRNAEKASIRIWFYQDEYVEYDCDFVDIYLKIK